MYKDKMVINITFRCFFFLLIPFYRKKISYFVIFCEPGQSHILKQSVDDHFKAPFSIDCVNIYFFSIFILQ